MPYMKCTVLLSLIFMPTWVMASLVNWQNPTPSALAPFQNNAKVVAEMAQHQIMLYSHPRQNIQFQTQKELRKYNNVQFSSGAVVVHATPQQIAKTLENYTQYVGLFPTLKNAKVRMQQGQTTQVEYQVSIPTPIKVLNFNEDVIVQHELKNNSLSSLFIDSPMPYGVSKIEWFALDDKRSLVTTTQWTDTENVNGFLIKTILKAMPEAKIGMPYGASTFVLESLRLKFNPQHQPSLLTTNVPQPHLTTAQYNQVVRLSQQTLQPISFIHEPVKVKYKHGDEIMRFSTSYQLFNTASQHSAKLLQPTIYQSLFPKYIRKIEMLPNTDQSNDAVIYVRAGLGVITIPFTLRLRFMPEKNNQVDLFAVGGDLRLLKGNIQISPYQQQSVWKMTSAAKIDENSPFLLKSMRSLPYHDVLPTVGTAPVIVDKALKELKF